MITAAFNAGDLFPEGAFPPAHLDRALAVNTLAREVYLTLHKVTKKYAVSEIPVYALVALDLYRWKQRGVNNIALIW